MSLIEWKADFNIGIASVDLEHRELIELINNVHGMMGEGATHDQVVATLGDIHAQISAHFALEEKFMRETGYEEFPSHKEDHENLLDELHDIMDRVESDGNFEEERLSSELDQWFSVHFRTHDAKLHRHSGEHPHH